MGNLRHILGAISEGHTLKYGASRAMVMHHGRNVHHHEQEQGCAADPVHPVENAIPVRVAERVGQCEQAEDVIPWSIIRNPDARAIDVSA